MRVVRDIQAARAELRHAVLTIGSFDGVHRGHQRILERVVQHARAAGGTATVLTFDRHPRELFSPEHAPNLLTSLDKKLALFDAAGIDATLVLRFTEEVAALPPAVFVRGILHERCGARHIVVGHDFRFGKQASGDFALLEREAGRYGITAEQLDALLIKGERVSSTVIRERILQGDLEEAEVFLGRKYSIRGVVVRGRGAGRTLGFPTANIAPHHRAVPAHGVYAAEAVLDRGRFHAAVNIGIAPTIRNEDITVEAFLLDFEGDMLGCETELTFHRRLRPELWFPSKEALVEQIARDVEEVRAYFRAGT